MFRGRFLAHPRLQFSLIAIIIYIRPRTMTRMIEDTLRARGYSTYGIYIFAKYLRCEARASVRASSHTNSTSRVFRFMGASAKYEINVGTEYAHLRWLYSRINMLGCTRLPRENPPRIQKR